jgi:hypothetical protein
VNAVNRQIAPQQKRRPLGKMALARACRFPDGIFHLVSQLPSATQNYFLLGWIKAVQLISDRREI